MIDGSLSFVLSSAVHYRCNVDCIVPFHFDLSCFDVIDGLAVDCGLGVDFVSNGFFLMLTQSDCNFLYSLRFAPTVVFLVFA